MKETQPVIGSMAPDFKLVKADGTYTYSDVRMVENLIDQNMSSALHPNPALNNINIDMLTNSDGQVRMQIVDVVGKEV